MTMKLLSIESVEFSFDGNGLDNVLLLTSSPEIVSRDCFSKNAKADSLFKSCESFNPRKGDDSAFDKCTSYCERLFALEMDAMSLVNRLMTIDLISDKENKQPVLNDAKESNGSTDQEGTSDVSAGHVIKDGAKNPDGRNGVEMVEGTEAQLSSGKSTKDAGCSSGGTDAEKLPSLAPVLVSTFATISWQLSIYLTVGIIFLMANVGVEGALTSLPVNTLVAVGNTARINCSTDLNQPVYWARTQAGSDDQHWLYYGKNGFNGHNADGRFSMSKDGKTGRYDVIVANVQPKDAGQYVCVDESGLGAKASAELVVSDLIKCDSRIPSDGIMGYNVFDIEQDIFQIRCSLTYTGNLSPTLEWNWPGHEVETGEGVVSATTSSVTSTLALSLTKEHNNMTFQCRAIMKGATQLATDKGLTWESDTVNVRYAEYASEAVEACPGVEWNLICNPQCSYSLERNDHDCQCQYTYNDHRTQQMYQLTSDTVSCGNGNSRHLVVLIAVAIVAAVSLLSVIILAFCLQKTKMEKRMKRWPIEDSVESVQNGDTAFPAKPSSKQSKLLSAD